MPKKSKSPTPNTAHFSGFPLTRWDGDRLMYLEKPFYYVDGQGKKWQAPKNTELNGATIPKPLWSIIGPPYVGAYRRASVVHDYFVGEGSNPDVPYPERRAADKMFFEACITGGCAWKFAAILYLGVSIGSWASKISLKHSKMDSNLMSLSIDQDQKVVDKYDDLKAKVEAASIFERQEFEALEALVEKEIGL